MTCGGSRAAGRVEEATATGMGVATGVSGAPTGAGAPGLGGPGGGAGDGFIGENGGMGDGDSGGGTVTVGVGSTGGGGDPISGGGAVFRGAPSVWLGARGGLDEEAPVRLMSDGFPGVVEGGSLVVIGAWSFTSGTKSLCSGALTGRAGC
jgi:hypothetical protein